MQRYANRRDSSATILPPLPMMPPVRIIIAKGGGDAAAIQPTTPVTLNMSLANKKTMEKTPRY
jgi:hypothetical protein